MSNTVSITYEFNNMFYIIEDTEFVHKMIQEDPNFIEEYVKTKTCVNAGEELTVFKENAAASCSSFGQKVNESIAEIFNTNEEDSTTNHDKTNEEDSNHDKTNEEDSRTDQRICNFTWTTETVQLLLEEYNKRKNLFRDPKIKKVKLWRQIQEIFETKYYPMSWEMLDSKFRNLKKTFTKIKDNNKTTGRGAVKWEFFDIFQTIFEEDYCVNLERAYTLGSGSSFEKRTSIWSNDNESSTSSNHHQFQALPLPLPNKFGTTTKQSEHSSPIQASGQTVDKNKLNLNSTKSVINKNRRISYRKKIEQQRASMIKIEEGRVEALKVIADTIKDQQNLLKEQTQIQKERNLLLKTLIDKFNVK